ncbi:MAG: multifunctional CCA addition/repair protein [Pseudomonadales bacterium]
MSTLQFPTYLVGGAVRDELLGRAIVDRDWVVVGATPDAMLELGFEQIGKEFPTFLHPQSKEEYALARTERKSGQGHTGFICEFGPDITLEEDLSRRDLTINAIAKASDGSYIDPYGGQADLQAKTLRHVSNAFVEDPLRVLRVARFAARFEDFHVHDSTMALMRELAHSGELATLTAERVWKEVSRALTEPRPSEFFKVLRDCDALAQFLPELDKLFGVPQPAAHHPEIDTGDHVMRCVDYARQTFDEPIITYAVLLHDLGKGITPEDEWPRHIAHEHRGVPLVLEVCGRLKVPKEYTSLARIVCEHHLKMHTLEKLRASTVLKLLEAMDAFRKPQRLEWFGKACEADARGRLGLEHQPYPNREVLLKAFAAAKSVDIQPLLAAGYQGSDLAEQIRKHRVAAIQAQRTVVAND